MNAGKSRIYWEVPPVPGVYQRRTARWRITGASGAYAVGLGPSPERVLSWSIYSKDEQLIANVQDGSKDVHMGIDIPDTYAAAMANRRLSDLMDLRGIVRGHRSRVRTMHDGWARMVYPVRMCGGAERVYTPEELQQNMMFRKSLTAFSDALGETMAGMSQVAARLGAAIRKDENDIAMRALIGK